MRSKKQLLQDELADLEWRLDPNNSNPDPDVDWVISRKLKVQEKLEELKLEERKSKE